MHLADHTETGSSLKDLLAPFSTPDAAVASSTAPPCLLIVRSGKNGMPPLNGIPVEETLVFNLQQYTLCAATGLEADQTLTTYVRSHTMRGVPNW